MATNSLNAATSTNTYIAAANVVITPQTGSDRSMIATFGFPDPSWVKTYEYRWQYTTDQLDGSEKEIWWTSGDKDTKTSYTFTEVYSAPSNATRIRIRVKYNSGTHKVKGKSKNWFSSGWKNWVEYRFSTPYTPAVPSTPSSVTIDGFTLTTELDVYDTNTHMIEFQVVKNDETIFTSGKSSVVTNHVAFSCPVEAGGRYKVRARALRVTDEDVVIEESAWSEYSSNVLTIPSSPTAFTKYAVQSPTSVRLDWDKIPSATGYEIEYTTNIEYFDSSNETQSSSFEDVDHAILTGLDTGVTWYFRLRAQNGQGDSGWSEILPVIMGKVPAAPTTWSQTSTATVGESVYLYWVHNAQDGSSQTYAELELTINGVTTVLTIQNSTDEDTRDRTSEYEFNTSSYAEGSSLYWRVRTKGVIDEYGDWSTKREVKIYAPPTLSFGSDTVLPSTLTTLPIVLSMVASPNTQAVISWHVSIVANTAYGTVDAAGRERWVSVGDSVYSKVVNANGNSEVFVISAGDAYLESGESYTAVVEAAMSSGLVSTVSRDFSTSWSRPLFILDAETSIDDETLAAYIKPYARNINNGNNINGLYLAVYRREYDGRFVEIASGIDSASGITVTDPHPALDEARYRIVATDRATGSIYFDDLPGTPIEEPSIVIQWAEDWRNYGSEEEVEEITERPTWAGSMLRLPYNVDVQDKFAPDVTFANYIGREHPVSYYGTQLGSTSSWSTEIPATDKETIFALRRLAIYQGDVYVREPSGSGYWAHVGVSFSLKHLAVTIPVTFDITRVAGGI